MQIESNATPVTMPPVLQTGFRVFFLAAIIFAVVSMAMWTSELFFHWQIPLQTITRSQWHGHEMVFGYAVAVIAGFLLTAVQNWTGQKTCNGRLLLLLFSFWFLSRVLAFYPYPSAMIFMLVSSALFYLGLVAMLVRPLLKTGNNKQWGIIAKVMLLGALDMTVMGAALGKVSAEWVSPVLLFAVYTVVGLILVMGARVIPGFTKNAIHNADNVKDWPALGPLSLVIYLGFVFSDLLQWHLTLLIAGVSMAALNTFRLWGWYDREIWKKPLVWVLHASIAFITLGILVRALGNVLHLSPYLSLHMMTYGGIAVITAGMMARVILGHTGRSVFEPPEGLAWVFILIVAGAVCRSIVPVFWMDYYFYCVLVSQFLWIGAFLLMLGFYLKALVSARVDGRFG